VFWRWIFYAMWQGALIYFVGFETMEYIDPTRVGASDLMAEGQFVYLGVVTLVNAKILTSTSNFTGWSFFFTISQTLAFVVFFWALSLIKSYDSLYGIFNEVFGYLLSYFAIVFMSGALVLVDNGLHLAQYEISQILEKKEKKRLRLLEQQKGRDHAVQKKRITDLRCKLIVIYSLI
jgi:Phospholipid-translocating P-type ATPase C-terminal